MVELLNELERLLNGVALLKVQKFEGLLESLNGFIEWGAVGYFMKNRYWQEISTQTRDRIVSFGERLSVRAFAAAFNASKGTEEAWDGLSIY